MIVAAIIGRLITIRVVATSTHSSIELDITIGVMNSSLVFVIIELTRAVTKSTFQNFVNKHQEGGLGICSSFDPLT